MDKEAMSVDEINMLEKSLIPERKGSDVRVEARDYRKSGSGGFADGGAPEGKQGWGGIQFVNGNAVGGKRWHRGRRGYSRKVDCDDGFDVAYCVRCSVRPKCDRSGLWRPRIRNSSVDVTTRSQRGGDETQIFCRWRRAFRDISKKSSCKKASPDAPGLRSRVRSVGPKKWGEPGLAALPGSAIETLAIGSGYLGKIYWPSAVDISARYTTPEKSRQRLNDLRSARVTPGRESMLSMIGTSAVRRGCQWIKSAGGMWMLPSIWAKKACNEEYHV
jgi:hypothetical protein